MSDYFYSIHNYFIKFAGNQKYAKKLLRLEKIRLTKQYNLYIARIKAISQTSFFKLMKKSILTILFAILTICPIYAQDIIYTISGEINQSKTALDSILVENLTNGTHTVFGNLPAHDYYQINLTKNAFWGTVGVHTSNNLQAFELVQNSPGMVSIAYRNNTPTEVRLSVYNINGQIFFTSERKMLSPQNSINVRLSTSGVFFVRIEAPFGVQTFKAIGSKNNTGHDAFISESIKTNTTLKSGSNTNSEDFSYTPGDSIRITAFKTDYYARPIGKTITASENVNFLFEVSATVTDSISDAYVVLNDLTTNVTAYDTVTGSVQITYNGESPDLKPGDIITIDVDTIGYLRKVIETTEEDGSVKVITEQAYLNEVFVGKDFKLHTGLMNPGVQLKSTSSAEEISAALTDEKGYIHPVEVIYMERSGKLITKSALTGLGENDAVVPIIDFYRDLAMDLFGEEGDNIHFYVDEGHVSLTSDAIFEFDFDYDGELTEDTKVKKGDINTFSFYLDSHAEFLTKLALDMSNSYEDEDEKKLIDLKKVTAKFLIGPVPFWVTFDVDIFGNYHINADATVHADWGFESNHTIKIGSTYNRRTDKFTPIKEYQPENTVFPLNMEGEVNASARFEVYPRAEIKFYSFFGPYAEIAPYAEGSYNAAMQSQTTASGTEGFLAWNSGIDLGLDFRTGIELTFLGLNKEFVPVEINGPVWPLWQSPTQIKLITSLPSEAIGGTGMQLKFKVADLLNDPVPLCPIYIAGDGTFSEQLLLTGTNGEATLNWTLPSPEGKAEFTATIYKADKTIVDEIKHSVNVLIQKNKPTVQTNTATDITTSSGTLNGSVTSEGNAPITERGFYWSQTNLTPEAGDNKVTVAGTTGSFSKTISSLQANSICYYRAFASNSEGTTTGEVKSFTTSQELSVPVVQTNAATDITASTGTLNGTVASDGNATITERGFYWSQTNTTPGAGDNKITVAGTTGSFSKTISSLQSNTTYHYRAYAINGKGVSTGETVSFKTKVEWENNSGTFTDERDNKTYKWVKIGTQIWMAENLAYDAGDGCWAYDNNESNVATYGRLYNWEAAKAACPSGWHLPTDEEWKQLEMTIGMSQSQADSTNLRGTDEGEKLKATSRWFVNGNGTDDYGFSAFPGGYLTTTSDFTSMGQHGYWWSATERDHSAWYRNIFCESPKIRRGILKKGLGHSVRCVKD